MLSSSSSRKDSDVGFLCAFLAQLWVLGSPNQRAFWGEGDWILFCFSVLPSTQPQLNTDTGSHFRKQQITFFLHTLDAS